MKICIVSDSHDRADALAQAVCEAQAAGAEAVIHPEQRGVGARHSRALAPVASRAHR